MKTLKLISKPFGLALLAGTLISVQPWTNEFTELASTAADQGTVAMEIQLDDGSTKIVNVDFKLDVKKPQKRERDKDGNIIFVDGTDSKIVASFTAPELCSGTCIPNRTVDPKDLNSLAEFFTKEIGPKVTSLYNEKQKAALEKAALEEKARGNVDLRQKREEKCLIKIVDINDKSKDINLRKAENRDDRLECKTELFQTRMEEVEDELLDDTDIALNIYERKYREKEMLEFRRIFNKEIDTLVESSDEEAYQILQEISGEFESLQIRKYLETASLITVDRRNIAYAGEVFVDPKTQPNQKFQTQHQLLQTRQSYSKQLMGTDSRTQAIRQYRESLLAQIDAILKPNSDTTTASPSLRSAITDHQRTHLNIIDGTGIPRPNGLFSDTQNINTGGRINRFNANGNNRIPRLN